MAISWVTASGQSGISEDSYEFAMQHQGKGDYLTQTPQERIDTVFDQVPKKRYFDQNNPAAWGMQEEVDIRNQSLQDPGPKERQQIEQDELNSEQDRTPLERQATRDDEVDARQATAIGHVKDFFSGGMHKILAKAGIEMPSWSNQVADFFQREDVNAALGVVGGIPKTIPRVPVKMTTERITSPAVQTAEGKVVQGENHGIAFDKAGEPEHFTDGFVTNTGRFVTRSEAANIAKKQEQVLMEARQTEELHSGELKPGFERTPVIEKVTRQGRPQVEWNEDNIEKLGRLVAEGKSQQQIAGEMNTHRTTIRRKMEELDLELRPYKPLGVADYPHMLEEFKKATSEGPLLKSEIADRLRISESQVNNIAKKTGYVFRQDTWGKGDVNETLTKLIGEGLSYAQIADKMGFTRNQIAGRASRLGLKKPE